MTRMTHSMFGTEMPAVIHSMPCTFLLCGYIYSARLYLLTHLMSSPYKHYLLRSCFHIPGIPILRLPNACPSRLCSWPGDAIDMGGVGYAHRLVAVSNEAKNQEELSVLGDAQLPLWPNSASVAYTAFSKRRCIDATRQ